MAIFGGLLSNKTRITPSLGFLVCLLIPCIVNATIRPVPWFTDGAVAFLAEFVEQHPGAKVLEFGSGASTIWFSKHGVELYSVEHDPRWHKTVNQILKTDPQCCPVLSFLRKRPYYSICNEFPDDFFDLIIVDGRNRKGCIYHSIAKLKSGGVLMVDNAERRYYFPAYEKMSGWPRFDAPQKGPDQCGFSYPGWLTSWWIKP